VGTDFYLPKTKNIESIVFIYDLSFIRYPKYFSLRARWYYKLITKISVSNATKIVTISNSIKSEVEKYYKLENKNKVFVIYPYFNKMPFVTASTNTLIVLGTLEKRKGIDIVLEAIPYLLEKNLNFELLFIGKQGFGGKEFVNAITAINNGKIKYLSYLNDKQLAEIKEKAVGLVMPSYYEGFGLPILEFLSHGKQVICSDIDVFREIGEDSVNYFRLDRPAELAKLIEDIVMKRKHISIEKILNRVDFFNEEKFSNSVREVFQI